jgi:thioredoxin 1
MKTITPLLLIALLICFACTNNTTNNTGGHISATKQQTNATDTSIIFTTSTLAEALKTSTQTNKPIFMDVTAKWCKPCKEMEQQVFTNDEVAAYYNTNFVNLKLDIQEGDNKKVAQQYGVRNYPTLVYLDSKGEPLLSSIGIIDAAMLLDYGKETMADYHKK